MLTFDEATHRYTFAGVPVPGVTSILSRAGLAPDFSAVPADALEFARQRGQALHAACEMYELGQLDESSLDPEIKSRFEAFRYFRHSFIGRAIEIETPIYSSRWRVAGTPDIVLWGRHERWILDWKSGVVAPSAGPQLAAYRLIWNENHPHDKVSRIGAVALGANGKSQLTDFDHQQPNAESVFLAALVVADWKERHRVN